MRTPTLLVAAATAMALLTARPAAAQQTASDSAHILLQAARLLQFEGHGRTAREVLDRLLLLFPGTPQADTARSMAVRAPEPEATGFGKTGFIIYHTLYGAFLGVAIPAAFGADDPEPYGAGLILGAPLGFFASRAYANGRPLTDGQSGIINFGSFWGTWQGFGWQEVLGIGEKEVCDDFGYCYDEESDTAPWASAVVGGLAGLGAGLLAAKGPVSAGTSSLVFNASLWGTWYGYAAGVLLDSGSDGDDRLLASLIGGNVGLIAAIPAARAWKPSRTQVRLASAGGLMGGVVGAGVAVLADADDDKAVVGIISGGVTAGLIAGAVLGRDRDQTSAFSGSEGTDYALVNVKDGVRLGVPMPIPTVLRLDTAKGRATTPGVRFTLFNAQLP
jgi:hypothetical protein